MKLTHLVLAACLPMAAYADPTPEELEDAIEELENRLAAVSVRPDGDIEISGVDLEIRDGSGSTACGGQCNGKGNLIVGYDQDGNVPRGADARSGSHNVVLGDGHRWTGHSGLVVGYENNLEAANAIALGHENTVIAPRAAVLGGKKNLAFDPGAVVVGGFENTASGLNAVVAGGRKNVADGERAVALGGESNRADGIHAVAAGGYGNAADSGATVAVGGFGNTAEDSFSTVAGGVGNRATAQYSSTFGYAFLTATAVDEALTRPSHNGGPGPKGDDGPKGDKGNTGPRGYTGDQGYQGSAYALAYPICSSVPFNDPPADVCGVVCGSPLRVLTAVAGGCKVETPRGECQSGPVDGPASGVCCVCR